MEEENSVSISPQVSDGLVPSVRDVLIFCVSAWVSVGAGVCGRVEGILFRGQMVEWLERSGCVVFSQHGKGGE